MSDGAQTARRRFDLRGQVQGVGFRPYVFRLATAHGVGGYVANNSNGAVIEAEAPPESLDAFEHALLTQLPPLARVTEFARRELAPRGETTFRIELSEEAGGVRPEVTPDAATCADCIRELFDPRDRRYRYPFINCTNCGPRYSIIRDVPYDRPRTTMAAFEMCPVCAREYHNPADRRFHAEPNACAACGPQLRLERVPAAPRPQDPPAAANSPATVEPAAAAQPRPDAIVAAAALLADGGILAVKGIGGYHLACRADREDVVRRLRQRKLRDGKPLAVMVPNLVTARQLCRLTPTDEKALSSPAAPIVLAPRREDAALAPSVAPNCRDFGLLLPYAPLHHLLFAEGLGPLVMTSANLAGQPLTYQDDDARATLCDVADAFLTHNREIFRPIDDSVVFSFRDDIVPIRRARGYAPRPLRVSGCAEAGPAAARSRNILALGGELKSAVCLWRAGEVIVSEHLGELTNPDAFRHFVEAIKRLSQLYAFEPHVVACDLHPRYLATEYAPRLGLPIVAVQHHHAHIAAVMAETGRPGPIVGLACDGTGYGTDHAVWGGEVLVCQGGRCERAGHLQYFPLVGADAAARETWRPAAALLRAALSENWRSALLATQKNANDQPDERNADTPWEIPTPHQLDLFEQQILHSINAPPTSSLGRVFDAVAYLLGLCDRNRHEAEAAMALEAVAARERTLPGPFTYRVQANADGIACSLVPAIAEVVRARDAGEHAARIAARFHETVARMLAEAALLASRARGIRQVALSGGCFANRLLLGRLVELLEREGLEVLYHRLVPSGDGGLALGQAWVAACQSDAVP